VKARKAPPAVVRGAHSRDGREALGTLDCLRLDRHPPIGNPKSRRGFRRSPGSQRPLDLSGLARL